MLSLIILPCLLVFDSAWESSASMSSSKLLKRLNCLILSSDPLGRRSERTLLGDLCLLWLGLLGAFACTGVLLDFLTLFWLEGESFRVHCLFGLAVTDFCCTVVLIFAGLSSLDGSIFAFEHLCGEWFLWISFRSI